MVLGTGDFGGCSEAFSFLKSEDLGGLRSLVSPNSGAEFCGSSRSCSLLFFVFVMGDLGRNMLAAALTPTGKLMTLIKNTQIIGTKIG